MVELQLLITFWLNYLFFRPKTLFLQKKVPNESKTIVSVG